MVNAFSNYAQAISIDQNNTKLNPLIEEVAELHHDASAPSRIELNLDDCLPSIQTDSDALRQVLNNLLVNAIQAVDTDNPVESKIRISTCMLEDNSGEFIMIMVADNGPGINKELRETLFEPYVSTKQKGSGLGLAIVKRIIENLGGIIWVEDNQPSGAKFIIKLPLKTSLQSTDSVK